MTRGIDFLVSIYGFLFGLALILGFGIHCAQAYGLFRMAKSCGVARPWLAWIPVATNYTIGEVAKCSVVKQRKKPMAYDKILLVLNIVATVIGTVMLIMLLGILLSIIQGLPDEFYSADGIMNSSVASDSPFAAFSFGFFSLIYSLYLLAGISYTILWYIALWHIFKLFDEKNAVVYLVLSIFVNVAVPVIFVILGNKQPDLTPPSVYGYGDEVYGQPPCDTNGNSRNM